jgi:hypothetical protein
MELINLSTPLLDGFRPGRFQLNCVEMKRRSHVFTLGIEEEAIVDQIVAETSEGLKPIESVRPSTRVS